MRVKQVLPLIGFISILLLAGCMGFNPLEETDDRTQAEKINDSMHEVDTAQTRVLSVQNVSIQGENNTSLFNFQRQESRWQYNFENNTSVMQRVGEHSFAGQTEQYQIESFYDSGTVYSRRDSSRRDSETDPSWNVSETNQSLREQFTTFSDEQYFSNETYSENLSTNNTRIYQINLLNDSERVNDIFENHTLSPMDAHRDLLDTYALEIYVNNSTNRLTEVRLYAYGNLTNAEVEQFQEAYQDTDEKVTGEIEYAMQIQYIEYGHELNITIPEEARNASDAE